MARPGRGIFADAALPAIRGLRRAGFGHLCRRPRAPRRNPVAPARRARGLGHVRSISLQRRGTGQGARRRTVSARTALRWRSFLPGGTAARVWNDAAGPGGPFQPAGGGQRARIAKGGRLMPHLEFTLLLAVLLSVGMAALGKRSPRERLYAAIYVFLCCVAATVAGSWGMYWIHG